MLDRTDTQMTPHAGLLPVPPRFVLRVGVTGARSLPQKHLARIERQVKEILCRIALEAKHRASTKEVRDFYRKSSQEDSEPSLFLISPLARGADRLVARVASEAGYSLYVPMPFCKDEYCLDFTGSSPQSVEEAPLTAEEDLSQFEELFYLASGSTALDGRHEAAPTGNADALAARSYEYVGRFLVRHSDLLIAIWDGLPSNGRGGTEEVVRFAGNANLPVWWIHASEDVEPVWIANIQELRDPLLRHKATEAQLKAYLDKILLPADPGLPHRHHHWIATMALYFPKKKTHSLTEYLQEKPASNWFVWRSYAWFMRLASGEKSTRGKHSERTDPTERFWFGHFSTADSLATQYSSRYRSSYVLVIVVTLMALIFGAAAVGLSVTIDMNERTQPASASSVQPDDALQKYLEIARNVMAGAEVSCLFAVLAVVAASFHRQWHERSVGYRILAELFRKQHMLSCFGWTLAMGNVQQVADVDGQSWIAWLFAAMKRSAPLPQHDLTDESVRLACRDAVKELISEQLAYHKSREQMSSKAGARLEVIGAFAFLILLVCISAKVALEWSPQLAHSLSQLPGPSVANVTLVLGLLGLVLPGFSAACFGIRSYAELQLLAEQSHHMQQELRLAASRVDGLDIKRALVTQDLGSEAVIVATLMLQDLEGWGRLFRGKSPES